MSSGCVLDDCHEVRTCICCVPLRIGCICIALTSLLMLAWGAYCILLTTMDKSNRESYGLTGELGTYSLYLFSSLNILLFIASMFLLIGACVESNAMVSVYVWFVFVYIIMLAMVMLMATITCLIASDLHTMLTFLLLSVLIMIVFAHFFLVTNSYRMTMNVD